MKRKLGGILLGLFIIIVSASLDGRTVKKIWAVDLVLGGKYQIQGRYYNEADLSSNDDNDDVNVTRDIYWRYDHDANGYLIQKIEYSSAGVDGTRFTDDDVVSWYANWTVDECGKILNGTIYDNPGLDTILLTDDDAMSGYLEYAYGANTCVETCYSDPGADGVWRTADDPISSTYEYAISGAGSSAEQETSPGSASASSSGGGGCFINSAFNENKKR